MRLKGKLIKINQEQVINDKFKKREFIIETFDEKYPQTINFQLNNNNVSLIDDFNVGEAVEVEFRISGKLWTDKNGVERCFNNLVCINLFITETQVLYKKDVEPVTKHYVENEDDLPF
jgi:hypothetical protein|tara:strand:- start:8915 stop:9268 length:354 start_codon:yes stop_codon:yes gene_type:complete